MVSVFKSYVLVFLVILHWMRSNGFQLQQVLKDFQDTNDAYRGIFRDVVAADLLRDLSDASDDYPEVVHEELEKNLQVLLYNGNKPDDELNLIENVIRILKMDYVANIGPTMFAKLRKFMLLPAELNQLDATAGTCMCGCRMKLAEGEACTMVIQNGVLYVNKVNHTPPRKIACTGCSRPIELRRKGVIDLNHAHFCKKCQQKDAPKTEKQERPEAPAPDLRGLILEDRTNTPPMDETPGGILRWAEIAQPMDETPLAVDRHYGAAQWIRNTIANAPGGIDLNDRHNYQTIVHNVPHVTTLRRYEHQFIQNDYPLDPYVPTTENEDEL